MIAAARTEGIPEDWLDAARRSPIRRLIHDYEVALPLHPEYRTMPMVWYIPPLSPVIDRIAADGGDGEDPDILFSAIDRLRIPLEYLAELFSAGDVDVVQGVLNRLAAMRTYMRDINLGREPRGELCEAVGMTEEGMYEMYRLLALAHYEERYVIPTAHQEQAHDLEELVTECSLDFDGGPGMGGSGPFGEGSGDHNVPIAVENFHALRDRQTADTPASPEGKDRRINLLNWDGNGRAGGLFPGKR